VKEDQPPQDNVEPLKVDSEKTRYGPPDGPRKNRQPGYDGREPLEYPGHEATAQFLATPESEREFDSITALAKHFDVSRTTVYRWTQDIDVLRRAEYLSTQNKVTGKLIIRREWPEIMAKLVEKAKGGHVQATKVCADLAWPEDKQRQKSGLSSQSLEEVLERSEAEFIKHEAQMTPTFLREREGRRKAAERRAAENNRPPEEPKDQSNG
jgi:hypothetical protein